ncbi:MAG: 30S ribosomal protein S17 [Chthonomonas sp.]|nr:30S ribosomal protein S17 [Chthonomonas sp.]
MSEVRNRRKIRQGLVVSAKMEKTVVVKVERRVQHPLYGKTVLKSERFKAHVDDAALGQKVDEGDTVEIMETRPISRDKHWRVTRIIEKVK